MSVVSPVTIGMWVLLHWLIAQSLAVGAPMTSLPIASSTVSYSTMPLVVPVAQEPDCHRSGEPVCRLCCAFWGAPAQPLGYCRTMLSLREPGHRSRPMEQYRFNDVGVELQPPR